jgi:hypothetical protein
VTTFSVRVLTCASVAIATSSTISLILYHQFGHPKELNALVFY